jgi:hypothetical protein
MTDDGGGHREAWRRAMQQATRFVQIAAAQKADGSPVLYALDETGRVWWLSPDETEWRPVSDRRGTTEEQPRYPSAVRS